MTKVPALVNYGTKYEVTVSNDRETYLVGYTARKSRRGLVDAIQRRGQDMLAVLALSDDARFEFTKTSQIEARLGDWWVVRFTGRTQKDALCTHSEYRYIGTEAAARSAV